MKPLIRSMVEFTILGVLVLVALLTIVSLIVRPPSRPKPKEDLIDTTESRSQELLCGPRSLSTALRRLGIPTRREKLAKSVCLTARGIEMGELLRLASSIDHVNAERTSLTWDKLTALGGTAVLFVHGSHFVAADPREKEQTSQDEKHRIRIYDEGKSARWLTRAELTEIWDGDAIVLRRKLGTSGEGPRIEWKHCLIDAGCFKRNDTARYRFHLRNAGNAVLKIESIKKSCNCAGYEVNAREISPGQSGWIEGTVRLDGHRGKFRSFLLVRSNDIHNPEVVLTMEAFVYNDHILSHDRAHFGQIPQGRARSLEIFVHDPGEKNLQVQGTQIDLSSRQGQNDHVRASLELLDVGQSSEYVGVIGAYPVKAGDYVIRPTVIVDNNCPVGPFTGKIIINTNLKSPLDYIEIPLDGNILPHVRSCPATVMLRLGPKEHTSETIYLESLTNRQFEVLKVWTDTNEPISVKPLPTQKGEPRYEIGALPTIVDSTERLIQTVVHFRLNEGWVLDVPVIVYCK